MDRANGCLDDVADPRVRPGWRGDDQFLRCHTVSEPPCQAGEIVGRVALRINEDARGQSFDVKCRYEALL